MGTFQQGLLQVGNDCESRVKNAVQVLCRGCSEWVTFVSALRIDDVETIDASDKEQKRK